MNLSNQKGFTAFEIVLVVLVLTAVGAAGYFAIQARQDKTDYSVNVVKKSKETAAAPAAATNDPYNGWKTYTGTCSGYSVKHPADWSVKLLNPTVPYDGACQMTEFLSPSGNALMLVPSPYGDGPGCEAAGDCPTLTTVKVETIPDKGSLKGISLAHQIMCNAAKRCDARVALTQPFDTLPRYQVGTVRSDTLVYFQGGGKPKTSAFYMTQSKDRTGVNPTRPTYVTDEAGARAWLASKDVQDAVLTLKSLTK